MRVTKILRFVAVGGVILSGSVLSGTALGSGTYDLYCRGPLVVESGGIYGGFTATFTRTLSSAGPNGGSLAPGQCAWGDRGVSTGEPNRINIASHIAATYSPADATLQNIYDRLAVRHSSDRLGDGAISMLTRSDYVVILPGASNGSTILVDTDSARIKYVPR
ncbi:hypothetical protein [Lysobacter tyrosinilyticus]